MGGCVGGERGTYVRDRNEGDGDGYNPAYCASRESDEARCWLPRTSRQIGHGCLLDYVFEPKRLAVSREQLARRANSATLSTARPNNVQASLVASLVPLRNHHPCSPLSCVCIIIQR